MPRPKLVTPTVVTEVRLPQDLDTKLRLYLTSDLDNKIPFGALARFFQNRVIEFFRWRPCHFVVNGRPYMVKGEPEDIEVLKELLSAQTVKEPS